MNKKSGEREVNTTNMGWTTIIDLENRLIIYVAMNVTKLVIDPVQVDPDGIQLVWIEGSSVTRVRRMTEEEFKQYIIQFGMKMEIDLRVHHDKGREPKAK